MESMEEEKSYTKWEWFLYIILLPCLFTLILVGIILTFMRVDIITPILEAGNKIPIIEKIIPDPKDDKNEDYLLYENTLQPSLGKNDRTEILVNEEIDRLEQEVIEKEATILQLEEELSKAQSQIQEIELELQRLMQQITESNVQEQQQKLKDIVNMYSSMTASKSAPIIASMDANQAVDILAHMDSKKASQILAKMAPEKAAELTLLLKEADPSSSIHNNTELQDQIEQLEKQLMDTQSQLSETEKELSKTIKSFELMDRTAAAGIFEKMWSSGTKSKAINILQKLSTESITKIIEKMSPEIAAAIILELSN